MDTDLTRAGKRIRVANSLLGSLAGFTVDQTAFKGATDAGSQRLAKYATVYMHMIQHELGEMKTLLQRFNSVDVMPVVALKDIPKTQGPTFQIEDVMSRKRQRGGACYDEQTGGAPGPIIPMWFPAIFEAAIHNRVGCIERLNDVHGMDLELRGYDKETPLHYAAKYGALDVVKYLLDNDVHPDPVDSMGMSPLYLALINGHTKIVNELAREDASVTRRTKKGLQAVHLVIRSGDYKAFKALLKFKINPNTKDNGGNTPVIYAAKYGNLQMIKDLVRAGANIKAKNNKGYNALDAAVDKNVIEYLESQGLKPSWQK
jgi:hypothetical protein